MDVCVDALVSSLVDLLTGWLVDRSLPEGHSEGEDESEIEIQPHAHVCRSALLTSEHIFATESFRGQMEARARANVRGEIAFW